MPNLYPALERQEVVIHGPVHRRSLGELPDPTLDRIADAWQRRRLSLIHISEPTRPY